MYPEYFFCDLVADGFRDHTETAFSMIVPSYARCGKQYSLKLYHCQDGQKKV